MRSEQQSYDDLCCYTLAHGAPSFIHQHVVDAFGAQSADAETKPIRLVFSLVGLFLHVERQTSGREVQRAHMTLARHRRQWPRLPLPSDRGRLNVSDVLAAPPGAQRDAAIDAWCAVVWEAYRECRPAVIQLLNEHNIV